MPVNITQADLSGDNFMLRMLPDELKNLSPEIKQAIQEAFKSTSFDCNECGGDVIPFNLTQGVCFHCKTVADLDELNYENLEDPENNLQENYNELSESAAIAFKELLYDAARHLRDTHGRAATELARRILTVAADKCIGTDKTIDLSARYLRPTGLYGAEAVIPEVLQ